MPCKLLPSMGTVISVINTILRKAWFYFGIRFIFTPLFLLLKKFGKREKLISVNFEVHVTLFGTILRQCVHQKARQLKLVGWVMNSFHDTIKGNIQGPQSQVDKMKKWLSGLVRPRSRISKCVFTEEEEILRLEYETFDNVR